MLVLNQMNENQYYLRQRILKNVGVEGQERLKQTKIAIIGAGGLGHPCGSYLAASGIGKLGIIDFDSVEVSNLNRQICFTKSDLGKKKALVLAERLRKQNPFICVEAVVEKIISKNIVEIISPFDMILDCSDNLSTKFLLHDFAWVLGKDLVQCSLYQYEGQLQSFNFSREKKRGCLRCLWTSSLHEECVQNCSQTGIIGSVAGALGAMQSFEGIKMILGLGENNENTTITMNLLNLETQKITWKKNPSCFLCSDNKSLADLQRNHAAKSKEYEIVNPHDQDMIFVDIREKYEIDNDKKIQNYPIISFPLSEYEGWCKRIDSDKKYLFICQKGIRSVSLVKMLRQENKKNCFSLLGGMENDSL